MPEPITITVHGQPAPQGSKRPVVAANGRLRTVEQSRRVKPWREDVKNAGLAAMGWGAHPPLAGPLDVSVTFHLQRPKSHYRTGRNAALLREGAPVAPAGKPDLDKLARSTMDALTTAGVFRDDAQVVQAVLAKVWAGPFAELATPGAVIRIRQVTPEAWPEAGHG